MEKTVFSDMKFLEPIKKKKKEVYMPYKQIGFFDNKTLGKNIDYLKNNLDKREDFFKIYNSSDKINKKISKINDIININEEKQMTIGHHVEEKENSINFESERNPEDNIITETKTKFFVNTNKNQKNTKDISTIKNLIEQDNKSGMNKTNFSNFNKTHHSNFNKTNVSNFKKTNVSNFPKNTKNSSELQEKQIQVITTKHNNMKYDFNLFEGKNIKNINNNQNDNKSKGTSNSYILKNQIISGHFTKETNVDIRDAEVPSFKNTLSSDFYQPTIDEADAKSIVSKKEDISYNQSRDMKDNFGNNSIFYNINNKNNDLKSNLQSNFEKVNPKIDFIYKKIFDKKSRFFFEKQTENKLSSESKKKHRNDYISNKNEFILNNMFKKKQYIEDKILDIKKKIFFIKGVYDFSYPKIVVNKVQTAQNFFTLHHTEQKLQLRESMNNTGEKFLENIEEKLKTTSETFKKSFHIESLKKSIVEKSFKTNERYLNSDYYPEIDHRVLKSTNNNDFKTLRIPKLTLSTKFVNSFKKTPMKIVNPIDIKTIYPDLGEPSKIKVIHIPKLF